MSPVGRAGERTKKLEGQVRIALWKQVDLPWEIIEYRLCGYYHCLPSQLRAESWEDIQRHLMIMRVEKEVANT